MSNDKTPTMLQTGDWVLMSAWRKEGVCLGQASTDVAFVGRFMVRDPGSPWLFYGWIVDFVFDSLGLLEGRIRANIASGRARVIPFHAHLNAAVYPDFHSDLEQVQGGVTQACRQHYPHYPHFPIPRPPGTVVKTPSLRLLTVGDLTGEETTYFPSYFHRVKQSLAREAQAFETFFSEFRSHRSIINSYAPEVHHGLITGLVYDDIRLDGVPAHREEWAAISPVPRPYVRTIRTTAGWREVPGCVWRHDTPVKPDCDLASISALHPEGLRALVNGDLFSGETILGGVRDAVRFLHDNGIAHNNIRPENVLITLDPRYRPEETQFYWPVLIGFGACAPFGVTVFAVDSNGSYHRRESSRFNDEIVLVDIQHCVEGILAKLRS